MAGGEPSGQSNRAGSAPPIRWREGFSNSPPSHAKPKIPKPPSTPNGSGHNNGQRLPNPSTPPRNPALSSKKKAKSKRGIRSDDIAERCSVIMSRTESILVSSTGDVIVCRCRKSSQPYFANSSQDALDGWSGLIIPCCDTDCMSMGQVDNPWSPVFDKLSVSKQVSGEVSQGSEPSTYEWEKVEKFVVTKRGLLGGAMHKPMNDADQANEQQEAPSPTNSQPKSPEQPFAPGLDNLVKSMDVDVQDGGILPLPSFDYSHFSAGHNDMLVLNADGQPKGRRSKPSFPSILEGDEKKDEDQASPSEDPIVQRFVHGVPMFLSSLSQIRITKVSAHPLGAHVLLISAEALLFSYGLNNHGQLGIGVKFSVTDGSRGFMTTPTIVTPLLENGGKTINCAAGVNHSLVVVQTEGRRIHKVKTRPGVAHSEIGGLSIARVTSSPSRLFMDKDDEDDGSSSCEMQSTDAANEAVQHHQIYGFGNNEFMKIGLVSATLGDGSSEGDLEDVLLPRRVALHCTVWPQKARHGSERSGGKLPPFGVFDVAASAEHSAALVRRATGDIEVYTWGNATLGALGLSLPIPTQTRPSGSRGSRHDRSKTAANFFPLPTVLESLSFRPDRDTRREFPKQVSLGPYCTFVVMSSGRCLSFGFSPEGMLGQGFAVSHTMEPGEIHFSEAKDKVTTISAGAFHCLALTERGRAYSWGIQSNGRLGLGTTIEEGYITVSNNPAGADENAPVVQWEPQRIQVEDDKNLSSASSSSNDSPTSHTEKNRTKAAGQRIVRVCAGYDSSLLVDRSGRVLACGKRSGRIGLGEIAHDVTTPHPMFGGLRLFHSTGRLGQKVGGDSKPKLRKQLSVGRAS